MEIREYFDQAWGLQLCYNFFFLNLYLNYSKQLAFSRVNM